ncbi:MAG: amidohydrolase [Chitinophagaceae bacterium]|nr:amidohydrolase [Chitinophagaceae bacterium]
MYKIDIHTHIIPETFPNWTKKFGYGEFIHLEHRECDACMMKGDKLFRVVERNCFSVEDRLRDMESCGVEIQVISTIPVLFNYWAKPEHGYETSRFFNDHIAETVAGEPRRFIGLGTVPMQDTELSIREMERCMKELKLAGIEIGTNINGENLSEPKFFPFFKAAEALNCPIFIHPWNMMGESEMTKYLLPWLVGMPAETSRAICSLIFSGVFEKLPKLRIAFAHGGGSFPFTLGRIEQGFKARPDLTAVDNPVNPRNYLGKFWVDSLVHDIKSLCFLIDVMGEDFVCLGSDYPFPLGEEVPGRLIEESGMDLPVREKLFFRNALKWLKGADNQENI